MRLGQGSEELDITDCSFLAAYLLCRLAPGDIPCYLGLLEVNVGKGLSLSRHDVRLPANVA